MTSGQTAATPPESDVAPSATHPFTRGFILSMVPITPPVGFVRGPLLPNFFVHPWTSVEIAQDRDGKLVVVIGTCVPVEELDSRKSVAQALLLTLQQGEDRMLQQLDTLAGRHAIVFGALEALKVATDATSMRSVFYAESGDLIASHALLVERTLGGDFQRNLLPFRYGYPGNRTPYARTRILTANTLLDMSRGQLHRFWPRDVIAPRTAEEVAEETLERTSNALWNIAKERPVRMALTAGLDSRATLAVLIRSGVDFETYTYGRASDTAVDRALAADLADSLGLAHTIVTSRRGPNQELLAHLGEAHYSNSHKSAVGGLIEYMDGHRSAAVTANLLEIGRLFYGAHKRSGTPAPADAETMYSLHLRSTPRAAREEIQKWGTEAHKIASTAAFKAMVDSTEYSAAVKLVDPFDLFYWEHRMSTWHGPLLLERDFYAEPFIPFNARAIFENMLGIAEEDRSKATVYYALINQVDPSLLDLPINPKEWPRQG